MQLLPQRARLLTLFAYVALLMALAYFVMGSPFPPQDARGLWFYAGLLAFLTAAQLEAPTHTTPAQAIVVSSLGLIATLGYGFATRARFDGLSFTVWIAASLLLFICALSGVVAILLGDATPTSSRGKAARTGFIVAGLLGRPQLVFSAVFLFALISYHRNSPTQALALSIGWSCLVFARPIEQSIHLVNRLRTIWAGDPFTPMLGMVIAHGVPGLVTVRHGGGVIVEPGTPLLVMGDDAMPNVALALNYVGIADGIWLRAIQLRLPASVRDNLPKGASESLSCSIINDTSLLKDLELGTDDTLRRRLDLVGVVSAGTDTQTLRFEVVRTDLELEEGRLLETRIAGKSVTYQLLDGLTQEEILQQKNTRGFVIARARKVGRWSTERTRFESVRWVPQPNTAVFLAENSEEKLPTEAIGRFPGTRYPIFADVSDLVTHNTAVLGILGVGKTFLSLELVERMILSGVRVICLDLTSQYETELQPYINDRLQARLNEHLATIGKEGAKNFQKNVQDGGSILQFTDEVEKLIRWFMDPVNGCQVIVVNPNAFEVWRQDSKIYKDEASMATLSAAEITRIFSEAALRACQALGLSSTARCCIVYEEAHSLVPEWNAVANEGDKAASNGTARAILQGRKFGLGCLVVTQRTASVTKTILNQCNTVFAMRVFDATGMEFLSNYIGSDYVKILSGLADRHAVIFGKGSSCSDPVLVRVNDRHEFLESCRGAEEKVEPADGLPHKSLNEAEAEPHDGQ